MRDWLQAVMLAVRVGWTSARASYDWSRQPVVELEPEPEVPDLTAQESEYVSFRPLPPEAESFLTAALRGAQWVRWGIWQAAMHEAQHSERTWPLN